MFLTATLAICLFVLLFSVFYKIYALEKKLNQFNSLISELMSIDAESYKVYSEELKKLQKDFYSYQSAMTEFVMLAQEFMSGEFDLGEQPATSSPPVTSVTDKKKKPN